MGGGGKQMPYEHHNMRMRANAQIRKTVNGMEVSKAAIFNPEELEFLRMSAEDDLCPFCHMVHCFEAEAEAIRNVGGEVGDCNGRPCISPEWIMEPQESDPAEE
jgi:hypothetical protein